MFFDKEDENLSSSEDEEDLGTRYNTDVNLTIPNSNINRNEEDISMEHFRDITYPTIYTTEFDKMFSYFEASHLLVSGVLEFDFINTEESHRINIPKSVKYSSIREAFASSRSKKLPKASECSLEPETEPIDFRYIS